MRLKYFLSLVIFCSFNIYKVNCNESCWNTKTINDCNIKTEIFKNLEFSNGLSMQIDCRTEATQLLKDQDHLKKSNDEYNNFLLTTTQNVLLPRFMDVQAVMLDGCQTPLNARTYGLEYLPVCNNVSKVSIRHFHMDILKPLKCIDDVQQQQLEYLNIQFNEISIINQDSFHVNQPHLRDILIEKNSLKVIERNALKFIRSLENLYIVNEPVLMLKFPDLFEYTSVVNIHLDALKQMTSDIFQHLPETLQNFYVANTPLDSVEVRVKNSFVLSNLTIKNCSLQTFALQDVHSTVKYLDLSGNVMKTFTAFENNVLELNLSDNHLEWVPYDWLKNLNRLETLILKGNLIHSLSLDELFQSIPQGKLFDFSQNHLQSLQDYDDDQNILHYSQVRLKCNQNPWNCLWLHEFAHYHPEKFLILQYDKFISKINVNGLECIPAEKPPALKKLNNTDASSTTDSIYNVSTYTLIYGNPWEFKRNQRAEALIIVFMLPLGIALLFLLLYMWIYCQKMFHLSYYKNFPCMRHPNIPPTQRFDVVRQLPLRPMQTTANDNRQPLKRLEDDIIEEGGYEVPLNGIISECNCVLQHPESINKCQKSIHITYEQLPTEEPPSQIYEEVIEVEGVPEMKEDLEGKIKPNYDHLIFK